MNEQDVPVFWDGGYWYVVEADTSSQGFAKIPASVPRPCSASGADISGTFYMLIRCVSPWVGSPKMPVTAEQVLAGAKAQGYKPSDLIGKPGQRVEVEDGVLG